MLVHFCFKGPAGNETNAIEKSETAETCHRHNIADLAVAFEMRGGGVCDDIMDILLLGDHTIFHTITKVFNCPTNFLN